MAAIVVPRIIIYQAAVCQNLPFIFRKAAAAERQVLHFSVPNQLCGENFLSVQQTGAKLRHIETVTRAEGQSRILFHRKGDDSPVDTVGAVTFGCIFIADIAETAQHLLAGSSLFACRTVTRLAGKDTAAEARCLATIYSLL